MEPISLSFEDLFLLLVIRVIFSYKYVCVCVHNSEVPRDTRRGHQNWSSQQLRGAGNQTRDLRKSSVGS